MRGTTNRTPALRVFETPATLRVAALLVTTTVLGSVLLGPVLAHFKRPEAISIYAAFSSVCHQQPERCWWLLDHPLAVCVRCLGFYVGAIAGLLAGMPVLGSCFLPCRSVSPGDVAGRMERFDAVHAVALVRNRVVPWVNLRSRAQPHRLLVETT